MDHENENHCLAIASSCPFRPFCNFCKRNWTGEFLIGVCARGRWALFAGKMRDSQGRTDIIDIKKWPAAITACNKEQAGRRCADVGEVEKRLAEDGGGCLGVCRGGRVFWCVSVS